ncbi:MAG: M48 family metallopeptidase [Candidatus Paceibacterota bacterium]
MATLYSRAESNTRRTWVLIFIFLTLVIGLGYLFSYLLDSYFILILAVVLSISMSFSSYWYSDRIVLRMNKAQEVEKEDYPELYRIVENLCITSGLPQPDVYVIESKQPNAFATGRNPEHGVVVATTGLIDKLEQDELEGVIAHELSHIGNRDALLQTAVVVLVGIVALLSRFFLRISFWSDNKKGGALFMWLGIGAAILTPIAATLIRLSISRKREFLADADGALLTRYPEGLASALEKISEDESDLEVARNSTAHLYTANPFRGEQSKSFFTRLFMTHPPVEERVKALRNMNIS